MNIKKIGTTKGNTSQTLIAIPQMVLQHFLQHELG